MRISFSVGLALRCTTALFLGGVALGAAVGSSTLHSGPQADRTTLSCAVSPLPRPHAGKEVITWRRTPPPRS